MFLKGIKIQRNKSEEGLIDAIVALWKKEREIVQKRKDHKTACNQLRQLREEDEKDDNQKEEFCHQIKIRRIKDTLYDHIDTIRMVKNGYLTAPDNMWAQELSEDEKKFVISYNAKIRYHKSTNNIGILSRFWSVIKEGRKSRDKDEKVLR
eukprot:2544498-Ditylum_brightwellii.AAC.1